MELFLSGLVLSPLRLLLLVINFHFSDCYDPMDPNGNITINFDIHGWNIDGYDARVTIQNYYQYRHVDKPGWRIGWTWTRNEVVWSMKGAFVTQQGDCSKFKFQVIPHSCVKKPIVADLMLEALPANKSDNCCRDGLLSAWSIDPSKSLTLFDMTVGNLEPNTTGYIPVNLTLLAPGNGYTCSILEETMPTKSSDFGGKREIQVFKTWRSSCTYSSFLGNKVPLCCVSLSTFYNPTVTTCPKCSCGCREANRQKNTCLGEGSALSGFTNNLELLQCTDHMCPIRVHWHVSNNYMSHWRAKLTISNYNYKRNYSAWNVLVQHPGFSNNVTTYSFNNALLPTVGISDGTALFWGVNNYNIELLQADEIKVGSVTTDILFEKKSKSFTLKNGWALPRRIYFNGEDCMMPLPDNFPMLPNDASIAKPIPFVLFYFFMLILCFNELLICV